MRISDWSSDVCSSDLRAAVAKSSSGTAVTTPPAINNRLTDPSDPKPRPSPASRYQAEITIDGTSSTVVSTASPGSDPPGTTLRIRPSMPNEKASVSLIHTVTSTPASRTAPTTPPAINNRLTDPSDPKPRPSPASRYQAEITIDGTSSTVVSTASPGSDPTGTTLRIRP